MHLIEPVFIENIVSELRLKRGLTVMWVVTQRKHVTAAVWIVRFAFSWQLLEWTASRRLTWRLQLRTIRPTKVKNNINKQTYPQAISSNAVAMRRYLDTHSVS